MFFDTSGFGFGRRHHGGHGHGCNERDERHAIGRGRFGGGRHGGGGPFGGGPFGGFFGGGGHGDGEFGEGPGRGQRWLGQGEIRVLVLALVAEKSRHGYEIIKAIEETTGGRYSPSPGLIYPTLSYLEDAGYVVGDAQGAKKHYSITAEGQAYLDTEKERVAAIMSRLKVDENAQAATGVDLRPTFRRVWGAVMSRARRSVELDRKIVEILEKAADDIARLT